MGGKFPSFLICTMVDAARGGDGSWDRWAVDVTGA